MNIYGLVGSSGTGKSYRAASLANQRGILYIIDDGLFINGSKVIAGVSAKRERTMMAAVRRALFMNNDHAASVKRAIKRANPNSILILGTSDKMIRRIVNNLDLPAPTEIIRIEDIATDREINLARTIRQEEGKHVIPVPTLEIRKAFSGYFMHPLRIFRFSEKDRKVETLEKTVMRPTYSYMGKFFIADSALEAIASHNTLNVEGVHRITRSSAVSHVGGAIINIDIIVCYGYRIHEIMETIQQNVSYDIMRLTGINILQVNVYTKGIVIRKN